MGDMLTVRQKTVPLRAAANAPTGRVFAEGLVVFFRCPSQLIRLPRDFGSHCHVGFAKVVCEVAYVKSPDTQAIGRGRVVVMGYLRQALSR